MQFKKSIALFLAFFLLISNSGMAFNVHYCGDKIAAISSIFSKEEICAISIKEKSCCSKIETTHKKCCSDKEINIKSDIEKIVLKSFTLELESANFLTFWKSNLTKIVSKAVVSQNSDYYCDANAPPLYQLYCQFTFFG